jgi:GNAT superfamily N-acetyltransferase
MAGWTLRPGTPADCRAAGEVLTAAGVAAWAAFLGEERITDANRGREHPVDLVAEDGDGLLGFVAWEAATGEVTRLYVHPRGWGSGAAAALLHGAEDALRAAGHPRAWLHTEERNARAVAFYAREGWRRDRDVRVRDWHGAELREPRFVKNLGPTTTLGSG